MFMQMQNFTRDDLVRAFDEFVSAHGQEKATATLKDATGASDIGSVPDAKIIEGITVLVGSLTSPPRTRMSARSLPSRMNEMAATIFSKRK